MMREASSEVRSFVFRCRRCAADQPPGYASLCHLCGGMVEAEYDLAGVRVFDATRSMDRYRDLLPISDPAFLANIGEGQTPCVPADRLAREWNLHRIYLKMESANPTGTTKDRMAAMVLSMFRELGITEFVSCSTGNSSSALARGIASVGGFTMRLYIGEDFESRLRFAKDNPAVDVRVVPTSSFAQAFDVARAEAKRAGLVFEAGFFNPARREGLKLALFEAVDQVPETVTHYVQAVSSAMGLHGSWKGARELHALGRISCRPKMIGVQQESCNPMVRAWREKSGSIQPRHIVPHPSGIAKAILRGDPSGCYPYVFEAIKESGGTLEDVTEKEILSVQSELFSNEGISCGLCSAAALAAVRKLAARGEIDPASVVLLNMTD